MSNPHSRSPIGPNAFHLFSSRKRVTEHQAYAGAVTLTFPRAPPGSDHHPGLRLGDV
ncbi:MAG TPA: hypothetical protein VE645_00515 [Pseudonocardiaceae bacterium]|nr:hypothetical protein [Pseudonocardiaceae bacterium]